MESDLIPDSEKHNLTELSLLSDIYGTFYNLSHGVHPEGRSLSHQEDVDNEYDRDEGDELLRVYERVRKKEQMLPTTLSGNGLEEEAEIIEGAEFVRAPPKLREELVIGGLDLSAMIGVVVGAVVFIVIGMSKETGPYVYKG